MNGKILGERIRMLRHQQKMGQGTLARAMEITANSLWQLEHAQIADPHLSRLTKAMEIFGVSAQYLLGVTDDPYA